MKTPKITIKTSLRIARAVIRYAHSGIDPRKIDFNAQVDGHLAEIGLGWILKAGTYVDGLDCQFAGKMAITIRANAVQKF